MSSQAKLTAAENAGAMRDEPATHLTTQGSGELRVLPVAVNCLAEQRQARDRDVVAPIPEAEAATAIGQMHSVATGRLGAPNLPGQPVSLRLTSLDQFLQQ